MPACHLVRPGASGISMVNIGPANAKTITDHVALLRPHAWLMLGHCAGLRNSQQLGDYVLARACMREGMEAMTLSGSTSGNVILKI